MLVALVNAVKVESVPLNFNFFLAAAGRWQIGSARRRSPSGGRWKSLAQSMTRVGLDRVSYAAFHAPAFRVPVLRRVIDVDINTITEVVRRPRDDRAATGATAMPGWPAAPGCSPTSNPTCAASSTWRRSAGTRWSPPTPVSRSARRARSATSTRSPRRTTGAAAPLFRTSCEAFLASFKVWNSATVGGNICMSLPAGPMITMTVALEATYTLQATDGSERTRRRGRFRHRQPRERPRAGRDAAPHRHPGARAAQAPRPPPVHPDPPGPVHRSS